MSDILSRLEAQGQDFQNIADRGSQMLNDFDVDRAITQGTDYAYRMGKEQLGALVGSEVVAGIHQGLPLAYKTGKTALNAYNRPAETAQAFKDKIAGKVRGAVNDATQRASNAADGAETQARNVVNETRSGADNPYLDEGRNFRYNVNEGTITTEGGAPATFGEEREAQFRTPLEQQQFENPALPRAPVGQVPDRPEFTGDQGNFRFQAPTQSQQEALIESDRQAIQNLPDVPEPAGAAQSIGAQRVPGEFIPPEGQVGTSYTRPGTQLNIRPDARPPQVPTRPEPNTEAPTEPLSQTQDLRARFATSQETGEGDRLANISEKYGNLVREQSLSQPIGSQESFTPRQEPGALDLEDIAPVKINTPTPLGRTLPEPEPFITKPTPLPEGMPSSISGLDDLFPAPPPAGNFGTGIPGVVFPPPPPQNPTATITKPTPGQQADLAGQPAPAGDAELQARLNAVKRLPTIPEEDEEDEPTSGAIPQRGKAPEPTDEFGLPKLPEGDEDKPAGLLGDIGKAEGTIAPEEEIADAIPGVGEILGGILGIGAAIEGAVQAASAPKPPQQPAGNPAMQTAFDSAPVIDSSDYHQL